MSSWGKQTKVCSQWRDAEIHSGDECCFLTGFLRNFTEDVTRLFESCPRLKPCSASVSRVHLSSCRHWSLTPDPSLFRKTCIWAASRSCTSLHHHLPRMKTWCIQWSLVSFQTLLLKRQMMNVIINYLICRQKKNLCSATTDFQSSESTPLTSTVSLSNECSEDDPLSSPGDSSSSPLLSCFTSTDCPVPSPRCHNLSHSLRYNSDPDAAPSSPCSQHIRMWGGDVFLLSYLLFRMQIDWRSVFLLHPQGTLRCQHRVKWGQRVRHRAQQTHPRPEEEDQTVWGAVWTGETLQGEKNGLNNNRMDIWIIMYNYWAWKQKQHLFS